MKTLWFDTETTGLDPIKNDIIQIAGIVEIDGEEKEAFNYKCRPHNPDNIDEDAIKTHGFTIEQIKTWTGPLEVYTDLIHIFGKYIDKFDRSDKFVPAGHNVNFDIDMLLNFFHKCNDTYFGSWMRWHPLDTMEMSVIANYLGYINPKNHKLETLAKIFGIQFEAHDAMEDIIATRKIGKKLLSLFGPEN